jgi:putative transposase
MVGMFNDEDYRHGRTTVTALHVHLVFVTKYRRHVFQAHHIDHLARTFRQVCTDFGAVLVACEGEDDHVHLLIEYPPTVQLSKLINSLKGVSSRLIRRDFPDLKARVWKGHHLWSPSYFAASCGGAPLEVVRQYVESQRTPES